MASVQHATPAAPTEPALAAAQGRQFAQALPGSDPGPAINASESNLGDYLNQPVQSILTRLGVPPLPPTPELRIKLMAWFISH